VFSLNKKIALGSTLLLATVALAACGSHNGDYYSFSGTSKEKEISFDGGTVDIQGHIYEYNKQNNTITGEGEVVKVKFDTGKVTITGDGDTHVFYKKDSSTYKKLEEKRVKAVAKQKATEKKAAIKQQKLNKEYTALQSDYSIEYNSALKRVQDSFKKSLVGSWQDIDYDNHKYTGTFTFDKDGKITLTEKNNEDMNLTKVGTYEIDGEKLGKALELDTITAKEIPDESDYDDTDDEDYEDDTASTETNNSLKNGIDTLKSFKTYADFEKYFNPTNDPEVNSYIDLKVALTGNGVINEYNDMSNEKLSGTFETAINNGKLHIKEVDYSNLMREGGLNDFTKLK
jgi:hypothetical protein